METFIIPYDKGITYELNTITVNLPTANKDTKCKVLTHAMRI